MSSDQDRPDETVADYTIDDVLRQLDALEETVSSPEERHGVQRTRRMLERVPGSDHIKKYTTRDIGEGAVGGIVFSLPMLVEGGIFEIADWFVGTWLGPVPVFLALNVAFVVVLTTGLLYAVDIRDVRVHRPIFGVIPRRLVGLLTISFLVSAALLYAWGRLHVDDPTSAEALARIVCVWTAASLGASLADILPGESEGADISEIIPDIGDEPDGESTARRNRPRGER